MKIDRILCFDGLRGIAAIFVALYHFSSSSSFLDFAPIKNGWLMVDLFFVLSGFVIDRTYYQSGGSFRTFLISRAGRMLPLYFFVLLTFLFIDGVVHISRGVDVADLADALVANVFLLQSFGLLDSLWFYGPSWSISAEIWINIIVFFLFYFAASRWLFLSILLACALFFYFVTELHTSYEFGGIRCLYGFLVGVFVSRILLQGVSVSASTKKLIFVDFVLLVFCYIVFFGGYFVALAPLFFGVMIFLLVAFGNSFVARFLSTEFLVFLGKISFSVYMTHYLVGGRIMRVGVPYLNEKLGLDLVGYNPDGKWNGVVLGNGELQGALFVAFYLLVVVLLATMVFKYIEMPCYKFVKERYFGVVRREKSS